MWLLGVQKSPVSYDNHKVAIFNKQNLFLGGKAPFTASDTHGPKTISPQNYYHESSKTSTSRILNRRVIIQSFLLVTSSMIPTGSWSSCNNNNNNNNSNNAWASYIDSKTGITLPSLGEIEQSLPQIWDSNENIFQTMGKSSYARLDNTPDSIFYSEVRLVEHVDENTVKTMTRFISSSIVSSNDSVLDLCSSWTSHIDANVGRTLKRVAGLGMNAKELEMNPILTEWTVMDLNAVSNPILPYEDKSFDKVLCQLSIDYLIHPLEVMREIGRVLKVGGQVAILFSNRLFIQKAIGLWTGADDIDHAYTVASYLHYSNGGFTNIKAIDLSTRKGDKIIGDPLYAVVAMKG